MPEPRRPLQPAETPHPTQDRGEETISGRFDRVDLHNVQVLVKLESIDSLTKQLVDYARAKDAREVEALRIEEERRTASAEAQLRRVEADTAERRTEKAWFRAQAERAITPLVAFVGLVLTGLGMYLFGRFGIPVPPVAP